MAEQVSQERFEELGQIQHITEVLPQDWKDLRAYAQQQNERAVLAEARLEGLALWADQLEKDDRVGIFVAKRLRARLGLESASHDDLTHAPGTCESCDEYRRLRQESHDRRKGASS